MDKRKPKILFVCCYREWRMNCGKRYLNYHCKVQTVECKYNGQKDERKKQWLKQIHWRDCSPTEPLKRMAAIHGVSKMLNDFNDSIPVWVQYNVERQWCTSMMNWTTRKMLRIVTEFCYTTARSYRHIDVDSE